MLKTYNKIAFSGQQRAGKDTAADYCKMYIEFFRDAKVLKFADPLYELTETIQRFLHFPIEKDRQLLQYLGTEYARAKNPNIWLDLFKTNLEAYKESPVLVTDGRFLNELELLRDSGFLMVRIDRPLQDRLNYGAAGLDHASELDVLKFDGWDLVINNDSTLEDYQTTIYSLFK